MNYEKAKEKAAGAYLLQAYDETAGATVARIFESIGFTTDTVIVPRIPTNDMLRAAQEAWLNDPMKRSSTLWAAMIEKGEKI